MLNAVLQFKATISSWPNGVDRGFGGGNVASSLNDDVPYSPSTPIRFFDAFGISHGFKEWMAIVIGGLAGIACFVG